MSTMEERIEIRCNSEQAKLIRNAAEADERSVSAWARIVLVREAQKQLKK